MQVQSAAAAFAADPVVRKERRSFDPITFNTPGNRENLGDVSVPIGSTLDVTHEVNRRGQGRCDERRRDVFSREERQDREFIEGLARRIGMHGRHTWNTGVEGNEEIEGLRASHLADDQVFGAHTQGLAHEIAQGDLPRALRTRRTSLHRNVVPVSQTQLEDLLAGDDAARTRKLARQGA